jgi:pSer/pThr/pTyr-binding forkhead associated (FHA) protein
MERIIVELLHGKGLILESRRIFNQERIALGRAYSNDLILDDLYVSPNHIIISQENGCLQLQDLGSENGVKVNDNPSIQDQIISIESGDIVSIGKTRLRIVLSSHQVEPTRVLNKSINKYKSLDHPWAPVLSYLIFAGILSWFEYMKNPGEIFWENKIIGIATGSAIMGLIFSGIFSAYTHYKYKKSFFSKNIVIANLGLSALFLQDQFSPFISFWILDEDWVKILDLMTGFVFMLAILWMCMRLVKDSIGWRDTAQLAWIPLIIVVIIASRSDEFKLGFQNKPVYDKVLALGMKPLFEPLRLDEFLEAGAQEFTRLPDK